MSYIYNTIGKNMLRFIVLVLCFLSLHSVAEGTLQEVKLDKNIANQYGFSAGYQTNNDASAFIVVEFPDSIAKNYLPVSVIITIKLASGYSVSFNDAIESTGHSHKTEVLFENKKDFIDASVSIAYNCKTDEGLVCRGRHYTIESLRQWQAD